MGQHICQLLWCLLDLCGVHSLTRSGDDVVAWWNNRYGKLFYHDDELGFVTSAGTVLTIDTTDPSDIRLKNKIQPLTGSQSGKHFWSLMCFRYHADVFVNV